MTVPYFINNLIYFDMTILRCHSPDLFPWRYTALRIELLRKMLGEPR